jgi:hypothetical protein
MFSKCDVPDGGEFGGGAGHESSRIRREIDSPGVGRTVLERADFFVSLCVSHSNAPKHPCCDPFAILGHSKTLTMRRVPFHCGNFFPVFHSPDLNPLVATADEVLAILYKCHRIYFATDIDFDG